MPPIPKKIPFSPHSLVLVWYYLQKKFSHGKLMPDFNLLVVLLKVF